MTPIYTHNMPASSWALLWWLIIEMDGNGIVDGGWRSRAALAMGKDRLWVGRCAQELLRCELIYTEPRSRMVRVRVENIA